MEIRKLLERIETITDEMESVGGEFDELKKRYHHLDARIRDLYAERKKLVKELDSLVCIKVSYTPNNYFSNASSEPTEKQLEEIEEFLRQASYKITEIRNKKNGPSV